MDKLKQAEYGRLSSAIRSKKLRDIYDLNPKSCSFCEETLPYEKRKAKFCNHSCSASYTNRGSRKHGEPASLCKFCNNPTKYHSDFCNRKCKNNFIINLWKQGLVNGNSGDGVSKVIKDYLRLKFDDKCTSCGWSEINPITKRVPLQVEHIDGNWANNKEENLTLLCPNCHSLTPTFGALNRGNGRDLNGGRRSRKKSQ
jgi:hypothetical protein